MITLKNSRFNYLSMKIWLFLSIYSWDTNIRQVLNTIKTVLVVGVLFAKMDRPCPVEI